MEMSSPQKSYSEKFISLSVATTLVPYSRDYIGRLAREGKIVSQQINRQWFLEKQSLLNFHENTNIEDIIKKRTLSLYRKNDLEVKDNYIKATDRLIARTGLVHNSSLLLTVLIIFGGLLGGTFLHMATVSNLSDKDLVQLVEDLNSAGENNFSQPAALAQSFFSQAETEETEEKIPMQAGVLLFPSIQESSDVNVEELFSDDVTVVVTSTTTGFIRLNRDGAELPFVRVPSSNKVEQ